jgi:hypothetical protein
MDEPQLSLKRLTAAEIENIQRNLRQNTPTEFDGAVPSTSQAVDATASKKKVKKQMKRLVHKVTQRINARRADTLLMSIYYKPSHPASFASIEKLYQAAIKKDPSIDREFVEKWLSIQPTYASFKPVRGKLKRRKVIVRGVQHQYQADLLDLLQYHKSNEGYKYLLTVIDCFSRKGWAVPLKTKKGSEVVQAFKKVFSQLGKPKKMQTDRGSEFYNEPVRALFNQLKIIHFSTKQSLKAQIVERFNRTLREKIKKFTSAKKSYHYVNALTDLLTAYNNSIHRSLKKFTPNQVNKFNEDQVRQILYQKYFEEKKDQPKFKIGDVVLLVKKRKAFDKTTPQMGKKRHIITDVIHKYNPPMYRLQGQEDKIAVDRAVYGAEIHKIFTELEKNKKN